MTSNHFLISSVIVCISDFLQMSPVDPAELQLPATSALAPLQPASLLPVCLPVCVPMSLESCHKQLACICARAPCVCVYARTRAR